jgi:hypothetical protein
MVSNLVLVACGCSSLFSSPAIFSANKKKQNRQQNRGAVSHKGALTSAFIKFLSVLTKHTGVNCNQPVEPAKDWRSDCLGEQDLLVGELCGFLGRLHSLEGLAQSNNNAKLNYSVKHDQTLLGTGAKVDERKRKKTRREGGRYCHEEPRAGRLDVGRKTSTETNRPSPWWSLFLAFPFLTSLFLLLSSFFIFFLSQREGAIMNTRALRREGERVRCFVVCVGFF